MFKYYVTYKWSTGFGPSFGCYEATLDHELDTFQKVIDLAREIADEFNIKGVTILDWKRLQ